MPPARAPPSWSIPTTTRWRCSTMFDRPRLRALLGAATILGGLAFSAPTWASSADKALLDVPVPPLPSPAATAAASQVLANPLDQVVTGASISPTIVGGDRPPSLEVLQEARPGVNPKDGLSGARGEALHEAALSFGARGGLAARGYAINEMLRRYEAKLDSTYDFRSLVVPVGGGQTLMRPPIVTEAQMAFALGDGGQTARETGRVYEITREAQLASAPPNWRTYLVRSWVNPTPPPDDLRPRTDEEVQYWNKWVAEGW
ncbi:MAG: type IV secretory system conjugative DNA transfer family protein, partial [Janthinobacterium lividum]